MSCPTQPNNDLSLLLVEVVISDTQLNPELLQPGVFEHETSRKSLYRPLLVLDEIKSAQKVKRA